MVVSQPGQGPIPKLPPGSAKTHNVCCAWHAVLVIIIITVIINIIICKQHSLSVIKDWATQTVEGV